MCLFQLFLFKSTNIVSDNAQSWNPHSAVPLRNHASGTMTHHPPEAHFPDTTPTSACPTLIIMSARVGNAEH